MEPLVSTAWLAEQLGQPDLRVLECTVHLRRRPDGYFLESALPDWIAGHVPGSAFADLIDSLSDPSGPHPCTAPDPPLFAAAMERLGVGEGTRVVLYDRGSSAWATRVWWLLRTFGFDDAAVLDGGWQAWMAEERPVSDEPAPAWLPARFLVRHRPSLIASKEVVAAALGDESTCIVNALGPEQHRGDDVGFVRRGHIPGALNVPARILVDPDSNRFLAGPELAGRFVGVLPQSRVITYCGGGIAATADAFALTLLGHTDVAVYDGSMEEWAADPSLPLELGD
jgi:thiosulfate/3-mercaptopyruvate sulfurtransferase